MSSVLIEEQEKTEQQNTYRMSTSGASVLVVVVVAIGTQFLCCMLKCKDDSDDEHGYNFEVMCEQHNSKYSFWLLLTFTIENIC